MYQVSFEHVERVLSYEVRLKFSDDSDVDEYDDDDAKGNTILPLFFVENRRAMNDSKCMHSYFGIFNQI